MRCSCHPYTRPSLFWGGKKAELPSQVGTALGAAAASDSPGPPGCVGHLWKLLYNRRWERGCIRCNLGNKKNHNTILGYFLT